MQHNLTRGRVAAVLEQENALPCAEERASVLDGDRQLRRRQRCAQMRGHVVRSFIVMLVRAVLGSDAAEIGLEIAPRRRSGILLDQQRGGRVAAKKRQQAFADAALAHKIADRIGKFMQAALGSANRQNRARLANHGASLARSTGAFQRSQNKSAREPRALSNSLNFAAISRCCPSWSSPHHRASSRNRGQLLPFSSSLPPTLLRFGR